ncbi:hypothetical protein L2E82_25403 [Cichorium intybus]|uniref:Uncharacterized protein n=1 Tax=Cichorium intybus TaxID=13427 RepID=A0ACB9E3J6_CICIN|nr:hypothetical protein L2E82_25403 [Cichorium intybus]
MKTISSFLALESNFHVRKCEDDDHELWHGEMWRHEDGAGRWVSICESVGMVTMVGQDKEGGFYGINMWLVASGSLVEMQYWTSGDGEKMIFLELRFGLVYNSYPLEQYWLELKFETA